MMLEHLGEAEASRAITRAIAAVTPRMKSQLANEMGFTTEQVGDMIAAAVAE